MNSFYLANAAGLWALLAIPAVLSIHLLQQKTRRLPISTLFLLQNLAPESAPGRSLQKLRRSMPLALQLLLVLLLTWMLAEPRWLRPESSQTIVLVLDSSASMSAFRPEVIRVLGEKLPALEKGISHTEWVLIESDSKRPVLYRGKDRGQLLEALSPWKPGSGSHDWTAALELAQTVKSGQGRMIAVTDRELDLPAGVGLLAVGKPTANVGFSGVVVELEKGRPQWRTTLQNYSDTPQSRNWHAASGGTSTKGQSLILAPREIRELGGPFPEGQNRLELVLDPDAFAFDDRLPVVIPSPKAMNYTSAATGESGEFFKRVAERVPAMVPVPDSSTADLTVISRRLGQPVRESGSAILFYAQQNAEGSFNPQPVAAEDHPLVKDINWQGLLGGGPGPFEMTGQDRVLLWQDDRPLVLLREDEKKRILILNFDFEHSNAARLPSFVILLNRFIDLVRQEKAAGWQDNFETNQPLKLVTDVSLGPVDLFGPAGNEKREAGRMGAWRTPALPGFFEVKQKEVPLVGGAVHFGDPREADLSSASSAERLLDVSEEFLRKNTEADPLLPIWLLLASSALIFSWWWQSSLRKKGRVLA